MRKLFLCTPMRESHCAAAYTYSVAQLLVQPERPFDVALPISFWNEDLTRVRSRYVRCFLESDCTHLLFVDSDVAFRPITIAGMLAAEKDFVAAVYPKKRVHWDRVKGSSEPEADAYDYPVVLKTSGARSDPFTNTLDVAYIGLGCALLSRACLQRMVDHYRRELTFDDKLEGVVHPTVALFQLLFDPPDLLPEDYSFCRRWRDIGGDVHMYYGEGAPVDHVGCVHFRGRPEAFRRMAT